MMNVCKFSRALLISLIILGCSREPAPTTKNIDVHGIRGVITCASGNAKTLDDAAARISGSLVRTLDSLDVAAPESDLSRLNRLGSSTRISLSSAPFRLIDLCLYYHEITDGAFDITTANVAALWQEGIPALRDLNEQMSFVGMQHVDTAENGTAILLKPGVEVNPGYSAAAYALDECVSGTRDVLTGPLLIELGYFARSTGTFPTNEIPRLPVRVPERLDEAVVGYIPFDREMAVSRRILPHREGRPERLFDEYLIDTRNGYPAIGTRQAWVLGPLAVKANALAEALLVLGREKGEELLDRFPEYEAMIVPDMESVELWMTPGFREQFVPAEQFGLLIKDWGTNRKPEP